MKKKALLLAIVPLLLTSCHSHEVSFASLLAHVNKIENDNLHPYYRVNGNIDMNARVTTINDKDGLFDQMPNGETYVENARYNEGFYCPKAERMSMDGISTYKEEDIVIFGMSSRSYWLRMPLRLHKDNFYVERADGTLNRSCGYANLKYLIAAWADSQGSVNPSGNLPYYEILPDGGFVIGGDSVRTKVYIDNYPYYMSYTRHPQLGEWDPDDPLPCYSYNGNGFIDGRFDIRFEYDKDGWLKSEYLATTDYDYTKVSDTQLALRSVYTYKFS